MDRVRSLAVRNQDMEALTGGDILSLITSGMYTTPLTVYREYIQNSADSIANSHTPDNGKVEITIDPSHLYLSIRDNGPGLSYVHAKRDLIPIAKSRKHCQSHRGFRGIGRLAGLAFGDKIRFLTRCEEGSPVTCVVWDGTIFRNGINDKLSVEETISRSVAIEMIDGNEYPHHFFEVQISGISRYAAASILNKNIVREYIAEVCPVAFGLNFSNESHKKQIFQSLLPLELNIYLDGDDSPIIRPHTHKFYFSKSREDKFVEFEEIKIPTLDGLGDAAVGWIAHSSYFGALPKKPDIRSIRARIGNIQIGDETIFDHLFSENRFNRWCVAEVHILDFRLTPNGRRDYFEPNVHLRNLENRLGVVCRTLEKRCRDASMRRNKQRRLQSALDGLEATYDLAVSGYLAKHAAKQLIGGMLPDIYNLKEDFRVSGCCLTESKRLGVLENKIINFKVCSKPGTFPGIGSKEAPTYTNIFTVLAEISTSPQAAKNTIEAILEHVK